MSSRHGAPTRTTARGGRPRSLRIDAAILAAARELLTSGGAGRVTVNAVAARSGVSRATVYRRWASRESLLLALVQEAGEGAPPAEAGHVWQAETLDAAIASAAARLARPEVVELLAQAMRDRGAPVAGVDRRTSPPAADHAAIRAAFRRGSELGDLRSDVEPDLVADLIVGALLVRRFRLSQAADGATASDLARVLVEGLRHAAADRL